ncbi:MAG: class I SAM-dependent methyltransferase [Candidatus Gastranaerophilales bacterium]|nr:class I SAM-dependent methyltransferase [Candidatus Gastranaerophilales bacterium]
MTDFILENKFKNILELGFYHGVSTCYIAGAIDELGGGKVTTIDLETVRTKDPNIETLLTDLGLREYVDIYFEPKSYIWRLMKMIEADPSPRFDFCYIDGGHNWYDTGYAFFLIDKLLLPGGWIIFDDLDWAYDNYPAMKNLEFVKRLPEEERITPQVRKVYELLVKQHPNYGEFMEKQWESLENQNWAYAKKLS